MSKNRRIVIIENTESHDQEETWVSSFLYRDPCMYEEVSWSEDSSKESIFDNFGISTVVCGPHSVETGMVSTTVLVGPRAIFFPKIDR